MVEQVVDELSSFRKAASEANEYVSQLLSGLLPSASKVSEASKELSDTSKSSTRNDDRIRSESNEAAAAASETVSLGKQILSELKGFSKNFTSLINGGDGSLLGSILGLGSIGASLAFAPMGAGGSDEQDSNQETVYNASYSNPETGFEPVEINGINFAPGAITSPNSNGAHPETLKYASRQNIDTTVNMFSQMQGQFGGSLTVNDFIPRVGGSRNPPSNGGGSMHWYGKAMDISTANMNDKDKLRLVEAALTSGFKGFGFGNNILHVDWGGSRAWGYKNGQATSNLQGLEYGGLPVSQLASWVSGGQKPEEVVTALESSPLSEPASEPPPTSSEDEMAADTRTEKSPQKNNNETQLVSNVLDSGKPGTAANNTTPENLQTVDMKDVSLAMSGAEIEAVNFKPEKTSLAPAVDLSTPSNYRTASLSRTVATRPVVTPAKSYSAPKETPVALSNLPVTRTPKPLVVKFDTDWILEANRKKPKTNETWMA